MNMRRSGDKGGSKTPAARKLRDAKRPGKAAQKSRLAAKSTGTKKRKTKKAVPVVARRAGKSAAQDTGPAASNKPEATSLAADCTIAQAGDIKARLARVLTNPTPVTVDLSEVRRIDTAGLQVLAAFIRERRAAGREVHCEGATESFQVTASLLGLGALFDPVMDERLSGPAAGNA